MPKDKLSIEIEIKKIGEGLDQVKREMKELGGQIKAEGAKIRAETAHMDQGFKGLSSGISKIRNLLIGLGAIVVAKKLAGDFLDTARSVERMQVRLKVLLGSAEEGKRLFDDLASYASKVPFELKEIMESATMLAGVMRGGRKEIMQWMPLIGDLAAAQGLDIQQTTEQIMRMLSAGAASADYFRDKGVLAFLGFQTGVSYSAEETRKKLWESWASSESRFRGSTAELAKTWDGMTSMLSDAWFQFMKEVMESGVFDWIKASLSLVLRKIDELKKEGKLDIWAREMAEKVVGSFKGIAYAAAGVGDAFRGWEIILLGLRGLIYVIANETSVWLADTFAILNEIPGIKGKFDGFIRDLEHDADRAFAKLMEIEGKLLDLPEANILRMRKLFREIEKEIEGLKKPTAVGAPITAAPFGDIGPTKEAIALNERLRDEVNKLTKTKLEQLELWRQEQLAVKGVNEEYVNTIYNIKKEALEREVLAKAQKERIKALIEEEQATSDFLAGVLDETEKTTSQMKKFWEGFQQDLQWSLEAGFFDLFKGGIEDIGDFFRQFCNNLYESFARAIAKMIAEWLIFKAISAVGGAIGGLFGGGGGSVTSAGRAFQFGGIINEPTLGLGLKSGQRYLFGEAGPEVITPARNLGIRDLNLRVKVENKSSAPVEAKADENIFYDFRMREFIVNVAVEDISHDGPLRKAFKRYG